MSRSRRAAYIIVRSASGNGRSLHYGRDDNAFYPSGLAGEVELLEGGAGSLEVGEFHLGIFAGEDDAVVMAVEGSKDGIANAVGSALAVGGLGEDVDVPAGPEQGVGAF
jgi:hypothetical protein